ncbi:putative TonB dependent receptor protein [Yersinia frederiksenii]|nr:putative TonB dependent receptor protein [Yersinia frederiksenii]
MGKKESKFDNDIKNNKIAFTHYKMHSRLAKVGWNLPADQRLALSYLQTKIHSPNTGMYTQIESENPIRFGWVSTSTSDVINRNIGLDYSLKPEHIAWLDATAKIYYVDTNDHTDTHNANAVFRKKFWTQTRLTTHGLQLQNTSLFAPADHHQLRAQYGLEWFSDRSRGHTTNDLMMVTVNDAQYRLTPPGRRAITSTFAQLNYDYSDWLRLEGGIRYDQFRLQGDTWMLVYGYSQDYTYENPCNPEIHEQSYPGNKRCSNRSTMKMTWDVDRREQQLSPTAAIGIKPGIQWLEFFANYGKSWRPPAITEVLATGSAHGHGWVLPNPFLAAEHSKAWEAGINIQHTDLFINEDRLVAKLAYFDTRVTDYINLELSKTKPKFGNRSFANATYINNLLATRFRGLEYQLSYDMGYIYTHLNYTRMIGVNSVCSKIAWLGGVQLTKRNKDFHTLGYSKNRYGYAYPVNNHKANDSLMCYKSSKLFGSSAYLPGDRGSFTLGGRIFDRNLDLGAIIRYNKGYQDKSAINNFGSVSQLYVADWPKYALFDFYINYKVTNNLTLRGSVENITNRAYLVSYGDTLSFTPNRGRTIQGGIEYRF